MTKKISYPNSVDHELLKNVFSELEQLEADTAKIAHAAQKTANAHWSSLSSEFLPAIETWKQNLHVKWVSVFSIEKSILKVISELSDSREIDTSSLSTVSAVLDTKFGNEASRNTLLAIASLDMQIDFATQTLFIPLSFSDSACGIIIAQVEELSTDKYSFVAESTRQLCTAFREVITSQKPTLMRAEAS